MKLRIRIPVACSALAAAVTLGLGVTSAPRAQAATLVEIAAGNTNFTTLVAAAQAAGLVETLAGPGPFTVFAPTDDAFARLPEGTIPALLADLPRLRQVLLYHVAPGRIRSTDLTDGGRVVTVQGAAVRASVSAGGVRINDSQVALADLEASNGVLHVMDQVLLPPPTLVGIAAGNTNFTTLVAALNLAGLIPELQRGIPLTVFAPTDAAFASLPAGALDALLADTSQLRQVLLYHLVRGRVRAADLGDGRLIAVQGTALNTAVSNGGVTVGGSPVVAADLEAADGVVHVIDRVILPPPDVGTLALGSTNLTTLTTALQAAGLVDILRGTGPFTIFAPTDEAFARLPAGLVTELLGDAVRLRHILLTHVLHGPRIRAQDLRDGQLATLSGAPLRITLTNGTPRISGARVAAVDLEGFNGVVHLLDDVILPANGFVEEFRPVISAKADSVTVAWPDVLNRTIQLESSLSVGGPWTTVGEAPFVGDGVRKVTLPATGSAQFFRLRE